MTSIEIRNSIRVLRDQLAGLEADARSADSAVSDRARLEMARVGGRIDALEESLDEVLADEANIRAQGGVPVFGEAGGVQSAAARDVASLVLGPRGSFAGMVLGKKVPVMAETTPVTPATNADKSIYNPDMGLFQPTEERRGLPVYDMTGLSPFLSTLSTGTCDGDVKYYRATKLTNNAAGFKKGQAGDKAESEIEWTPATANMEILAHWVPVSKVDTNRYSNLATVINGQLMVGLQLKRDAVALWGDTTGGIKGICKDTAITTYTKKSGDTIADHARRMITKSVTATGMYPDHVCISPEAKEAMDLLKDTTGTYLRLTLGGTTWGLPVVEDVNMVQTSGGTTKHGMLVYNSHAATWLTADQVELSVGLIDRQFVNNAYTLLAESSHALMVPYPESFVLLDDCMPAASA